MKCCRSRLGVLEEKKPRDFGPGTPDPSPTSLNLNPMPLGVCSLRDPRTYLSCLPFKGRDSSHPGSLSSQNVLSSGSATMWPVGHILFFHQRAAVLGGTGTIWIPAKKTPDSPVTTPMHACSSCFSVLQVEANIQHQPEFVAYQCLPSTAVASFTTGFSSALL